MENMQGIKSRQDMGAVNVIYITKAIQAWQIIYPTQAIKVTQL